jgi:hypothetical protein
MGLEGKILTVIEPTLKLDELKFKAYNEQEGDNPGDNNTTRELGIEFPLVVINGYRFFENDIKALEIELSSAVPTISLSLVDNKGIFTADNFPRDGDVVNVRIASKAKNDYKDIRIDFDIDDIDSPPASSITRGGDNGVAKFSITGSMKIPGINAEQCKSYDTGGTIDHLESIASDLKLGLASNVETTDDAMKLVTPYEPLIDTITSLVKHSYVGEDSFQTFCIDPYYYINFVDLNLLLNAEENFEETLSAFNKDYNDMIGPDASDKINEQKSQLILSSHNRIAETNLHIAKYSLKNNSGKAVKKNGYKRTLQFYDNDSEEGMVSFDIEPLTSKKLKDIEEPLKGRRDEDRYKTEVKFKYMGRRHSDPETSNTHLNYTFAELHNKQNLDELNKMYLEVELSSFNAAIRRYQKIPIAIFSESVNQIGADALVKKKKESLGFDSKPPADIDDDLSDKNAIDEFLSGFYIVDTIKYTYTLKSGKIKQTMKLLRREWPSRLNNLE